MKRNPAGYMSDHKRHTRRTIEGNGLMARGGPKSGRAGRGKGGKLRGRGRLNSR